MDKKVIHSIFEEVVKRTPLRIAIKTEDDSITYGELNSYANRLAALLQSLGSQSGKIVNVVAPSSIHLVASMLGIFKSGNIYLPVDFSSSEKRLMQIFKDTFNGIVIVSPDYKEILIDFFLLHNIGIDYLIVAGEDGRIELYQLTDQKLNRVPYAETDLWKEDPVLTVKGEDSNYIFYTSGSTGEAKAIEGLHVSLSHFIHWEIKEFQIDESFHVSQLTQVTFDASLRDIFVALIAGGTLCIPSMATKTNPARLLKWLEEEKINLLHCVPSLFRVLTKELHSGKNAGYDNDYLKYILMAGELLYTKDILNWRKIAGTKTKLVNLYGATETTLIKTFYRIEQVSEIPSLPIPVGMPISNTIIAIVKDNDICKAGEIGEIYVKTPFITKGYYKNETLTKSVFVQNPLTHDTHDIVYKTGDLGRYLPDGNIEVLGRLDSQVKINGIRVELNEIEKAILNLDQISGVVAKSHRTDDNFNSLIAYYTGEKRDAEEFRNSLAKVLNQQVIPSYFIHMEEFPLNMNGKVDRKALPVPEDIIMEGMAFEAPAGELEETLARFWKEILGLEKIGRDISFFSIGGHSLRAIQLAARIQREFGISIKIADIFLHKTIGELAAFIAVSSPTGYQHIKAAEPASSYPLSSAQRRLWVLSQFEGASAAYNMPGAYIFEGDLSEPSLVFAFRQLIERHEILRTVFRENDKGEVSQFIHSNESDNFRIRYLDLRGEEATEKLEKLVQKSLSEPFDLAEGPLIRAVLFRLEDKKWLFTCVMHHIISDGWSMGIFIDELLLFYNNHVNEMTFSLAPLRIQYKDYAVWQQEQLSGESLSLHKNYWLKQFEGELPVMELMTDRSRPVVKTYNGHIITKKIDQSALLKFKAVTEKQEGTLFMGLLAVINALFYRYTGQEDIIIGSPTAGREHVDLEDQIGFYLNMLAFRTRFSGSDSYLDLLQEVKQVTLNAYEHQIYPFDELIDELQLQRDMSRSALFDVMIILQNIKHNHTDTSDFQNNLMVNAYGAQEHVVSKYDLTFNFYEENNEFKLSIEYNTDIYNADTIIRISDHFGCLLEAVSEQPSAPISSLVYLDEAQQLQLLETFNDTIVEYQEELTIIDLFRKQALATPDDIAVVSEGKEFSYNYIDGLSDSLSNYLCENYALETNDLIGIELERSEWLIISILAVMKSGAAYVPIDPGYPAERKEYIIKDSKCKVVFDETVLSAFSKVSPADLQKSDKKVFKSDSIAYCIYTSGTTGNPKGCLLSHQNVVNFFMGMNNVFGEQPGTMLSLTNFTFDISVLELLWTLTLGYKVVIQNDVRELVTSTETEVKPLEFSLFYFGNAEPGNEADKYKLLLEGAKFADNNGFSAVWTPERHFHEFGGLYPNPAVLGAALSTVTKNVSIRAGSVVFPLHHPLRIAEEWSVVDNLSGGRVEIACASGWNANDFVFSPESYQQRHEAMYESIATVQRLWQGETVTYKDGNGILKDIRVFPKPLNPVLPLWITSANSIDTFISAGKLGFNVLTHLLGETVDGLAIKIAAYRKAYQESGHDITKSKVALMLHTYIGEDLEATYAVAKKPFINYLRTSAGLVKSLAADLNLDVDAEGFTEQDMDALLEHSFNRYVSSASLIGTRQDCMLMLKKLSHIGVNEIACLIDFGVDCDRTMKGLEYLNDVKMAYHADTEADSNLSVHQQAGKYQITHLQATPSMASLLQAYLGNSKSIRTILLGGERVPLSLIKSLYSDLPDVEIYNMYGPTETTIWSTCWKAERDTDKILIGKPIANTRIYILDSHLNLLPVGAVGEVYIGGKGVADGYINNPELSAQRFIENPFCRQDRLYRTGDFAKWLSDGNIDYVGRQDDQVKVHGHRIELGEIETVLQQNKLVTGAAILLYNTPAGDKELMAYVTGTEKLNVTDLRAGLVNKLPAYMIPERYVQVDYFPLTYSGKVDKRKLQDMQGRQVDITTVYVAPRNEMERSLEIIWKEILDREHIGISDNFFDIGGNSIKIVRMIAVVNKTFTKRLSVAMAFKFSNISTLAAYLLADEEVADMAVNEEELDMSVNVMEETFSLLNYDTDED